MNQIIRIFYRGNYVIFFIFVFLIFSNCSFIKKNNYSFYETFINPDVSELSEEFDNVTEKPDLDSVPESEDIDE
mgnify:CR=1 FL=1